MGADVYIAILFLPLAGAVLMPLIPPRYAAYSGVVGSLFTGASAVLAFAAYFSASFPVRSEFTWLQIRSGEKEILSRAGIFASHDMVLTLTIVSLVAFLVHIFSISYMANDESRRRYFGYLGLFTFSMYGILLSGNLLQLFVFWELVGVTSYLLIGFWYQRERAAAAGKKAFLVNRVADTAFLLGLIVLWNGFGTLDFTGMQELLNGQPAISGTSWLWWGGFLVFCGAVGKSAQFPLHVWLPDAMEGPTPVSALLHAATMVAAGVVLLLKVFPILHPDVLTVIAFVGAITTIAGAYGALMQYDLKRILAYSTISQLGYMMMGIGVGASNGALFHLITHASFKAGLFLCAGAIIHAYQHVTGEGIYDIRQMGGIRKQMPVVFGLMLLFSAALAGLPFFSGFLSKDAILVSAMQWADIHGAVFWLVPVAGLLVVLITALYMGRLIMVVFFGEARSQTGHRLQFGSYLMRIPLFILALGSLFFFYSWNPVDYSNSWLYGSIGMSPNFWLGRIQGVHSVIVPLVSFGLALSGILTGYLVFRPGGAGITRLISGTAEDKFLYRLGLNNYYLDKFYDRTFVRGVTLLARITDWFDRKILDGILHGVSKTYVVLASLAGFIDKYLVDGLVNLVASAAAFTGKIFSGIQTGRIQSYIFAAIVAMLILIWILIG